MTINYSKNWTTENIFSNFVAKRNEISRFNKKIHTIIDDWMNMSSSVDREVPSIMGLNPPPKTCSPLKLSTYVKQDHVSVIQEMKELFSKTNSVKDILSPVPSRG